MSVSTLLAATADHDRKPTVIDESHLARMTLGDRRLEREVLELFVRQTTIMLGRIVGAATGMGRGGGAYAEGLGPRHRRVARRARRGIGGERRERRGRSGGDAMEEAVTELKAASLEASAAIGSRLTGLLAELARGR